MGNKILALSEKDNQESVRVMCYSGLNWKFTDTVRKKELDKLSPGLQFYSICCYDYRVIILSGGCKAIDYKGF